MPRTIIRSALTAFALLATGLATTIPSFAQAAPQNRCGAHAEISGFLGKKYKEKQSSLGVIGNAAVIEVYVSQTGTWTILMTQTDGRSCIMAAGHSWEEVPIQLGQAT